MISTQSLSCCEELLRIKAAKKMNLNSIYFGIYSVSVEGETKGEGEEPLSLSVNI